jgi:hypothetical protein
MEKLTKIIATIFCLYYLVSCGQPTKVPMKDTEIIGSATIDKDGTIYLNLVAEAGSVRGHSLMVIKKSDRNYNEIKSHIGDIQVGEDKLVRAWPTKKRS